MPVTLSYVVTVMNAQPILYGKACSSDKHEETKYESWDPKTIKNEHFHFRKHYWGFPPHCNNLGKMTIMFFSTSSRACYKAYVTYPVSKNVSIVLKQNVVCKLIRDGHSSSFVTNVHRCMAMSWFYVTCMYQIILYLRVFNCCQT